MTTLDALPSAPERTAPPVAPAGPPAALPRSRFRTDIEGLRAVAVLLVIADHLLLRPGGGFIGVDVFFVISGFLISGLLIGEGERTGRISVREFYARRVRRIMPGALLVLLATVIAARFVVTASRAQETWHDAVWSAFFLANVHFNDVGTDYFAQGSPPSALQHYWSLSVEEQFYVVWPVTLLLVFLVVRRKLHLPARPVIAVLALLTMAASFAWCVHLTAQEPTDAYFSTAARAWELSLGALLAVGRDRLLRLPTVLRSGLAWVGLAGIGVAAVVITESTPFPGYAAALPVVATGLVLAGGNPAGGPGRTFVLGNPVVQYVGALSYSLYLWHFPAIVLSAAYWGDSGFAYYLCAGAVPAILAVLSFHLLENPVRQSKWLSAKPVGYRRPTFGEWYRDNKTGLDVALVGTAVTAFLIAGFLEVNRSDEPAPAGLTTASAPQSVAPGLSPQQRAISAALQATSWPALKPSLDDLARPPAGCTDVDASNVGSCSYGDPAAPRTAVVVGDSIAMAWTPAVRAALGDGWRVQMLTMSECPAQDLPTWRNRATSGRVYAACAEHRDWVQSEIARQRPDLVVAAALPDFANRVVGVDPADRATAWRDGTERFLRSVAAPGRRAVVLEAPPNSGNLQTCVTRVSSPADCIGTINGLHRAVVAAEAAAATAAGSSYVRTADWFCFQGRCPAVVGSTPVMRDGTHLTADYAASLGPLLRPALLPQ